MNQLFIEWKDRYVSTDGILNEELYWKNIPRITFLLKEMYEETYIDNKIAPLPEGYKDGYGPYGSSPSFWRNLRSWQYLITTRTEQAQGKITPDEANARLTPENVDKIKETSLTGVGYVNIKKVVGNNTSDWEDIYSYARNDADLLKRQLDLMNPQVIVCCGYSEIKGSVFDCLKIINPGMAKATQISNCFHIFDNRILVVDWWHPAARGSYMKWDCLDTPERFQNHEILEAIKKLNWGTDL
jgi:hypothetical protein